MTTQAIRSNAASSAGDKEPLSSLSLGVALITAAITAGGVGVP
jgi:hypothetical protein